MYDTLHDANMRLSDCVVMQGADPVYINEVRGDDQDQVAVYTRLADGVPGTLPLTRANFDITPVRTGYVNLRDTCVYVQRLPVRRWKQGLNRENSQTAPLSREEHRDIVMDVLNSREMAATILNEYPAMPEALQAVQEGRSQCSAWHRHFAFARDRDVGLVWLYYRNDKIGWMQDGEPVLGAQYTYLNEELQGAMA